MPFALVKWLHGREKNTYTVLDSSWVLEVDLETFNNQEGEGVMHVINVAGVLSFT